MKKFFYFTLVIFMLISSCFFSCANHTRLITVTEKKKIEDNTEQEITAVAVASEDAEDSEASENDGEEEGEDDSEKESDEDAGGISEGANADTEDNQESQEGSPAETPEENPEANPPVIEDEKKPLTLMVYMAADNDLESYALENLKMLEQGKSGSANVIVLLDRAEGYDQTNGDWTDTRLFEVCRDAGNGSLIVSRRLSSQELGLFYDNNTELDMANPYVLRKFVEFCKGKYEAEKYALIIWGHGTGWRYSGDRGKNAGGSEKTDLPDISLGEVKAVAIDDKTGSYMTVAELGKALRGQGLNVIGFDTCFGGVFENVYELKDCAEYTVACPGVIPSEGWNYKRLLEKIQTASEAQVISSVASETSSSSGEAPAKVELSSRSIAEAMSESSAVQTTIFINSKLPALMTSFEQFSRALSESIRNQNDRRTVLETLLASRAYRYFQYPCDLYLDFISMSALYKDSAESALQEAAKNLKIQAEEAAYCSEQIPPGIGIHFIPLISTHTTATKHSPEYVKNPNITGQGKFIQDSSWWVPTFQGNSDSLLDKLFYASY